MIWKRKSYTISMVEERLGNGGQRGHEGQTGAHRGFRTSIWDGPRLFDILKAFSGHMTSLHVSGNYTLKSQKISA